MERLPGSTAVSVHGYRDTIGDGANYRRARTYRRSACNTILDRTRIMQIFPGLGFGTILAEASRITDAMVLESAYVLADYTAARHVGAGRVYPPMKELQEVSIRVATQVRPAPSKKASPASPASKIAISTPMSGYGSGGPATCLSSAGRICPDSSCSGPTATLTAGARRWAASTGRRGSRDRFSLPGNRGGRGRPPWRCRSGPGDRTAVWPDSTGLP